MLLLDAAVAWAAPRPRFEPVIPDWSMPFRDICASSGLRVVTYTDDRSPIVTVAVVLEGGSAADPPGKEGLAHLVEHLWFRAKLPGGETVADELDPISIRNGLTYADETVFLTQAPLAELHRILTIEGHRFLDPLAGVDAEIFAAERQIVAQELRRNVADDLGADERFLFAGLFGEAHPYGRLGIQSDERVLALSLEDARAFASTHIRPERSSVHVLGAISGEQARRAVWRAFPDPVLGVPVGSPPKRCLDFETPEVAVPAPDRTTATVRVQRPTPYPKAIVAWAVPGGFSPDAIAMEPAVELVEGILDARGGWRCSLQRMRLANVLSCTAARGDRTDPSGLLSLDVARLAGARDALSRAAAGRIWTASLLSQIGSVLRGAEALVAPLTAGDETPFRYSNARGQPAYHEARWAALGTATLDAAFTFIETWLTPDRAVHGIVEPIVEAQPAVTTRFAIATDGGFGPTPSRETLLGRAIPVDPDDVELRHLKNGLQVAVVRRGTVPTVTVELAFRQGWSAGPSPGFAAVASASTVSYVMNAQDDLYEQTLRVGIRARFFETAEVSGFRWSGPAGTLAEMLWLARKRLEGTRISRGEERDVAELLARELERWMDDPRGQVSSLAASSLFDDDPWSGRPNHAQWRSVQKVNDAKLSAFLHGSRQPGNGVLVIAGLVDPERAFEAAETWLGRWPVPKAPVPGRGWEPLGSLPPREEITLADIRGLANARIALACRLGGEHDDARLGAVAALAQRAAHLELRVRSGLAYDPWAGAEADPVAGNVLLLGATLAPGSIEEGRSLLRAVIDRLARDVDDRAAVASAGTAAVGWLMDAATTSDLAGFVRTALLRPGGLDSIHTRAQRLASTTGADLRAIVAPCPARVTYIAMGNRELLAPALASSGLPVREVDWQQYKREQTGADRR